MTLCGSLGRGGAHSPPCLKVSASSNHSNLPPCHPAVPRGVCPAPLSPTVAEQVFIEPLLHAPATVDKVDSLPALSELAGWGRSQVLKQ